MKKLLTAFFLLSLSLVYAQETESPIILSPGILGGITAEANENFPETDGQGSLVFNLLWDQKFNSQEWARRLKGPRTGLSLAYTDFGNRDSLGSAFTVMPIIEFGAFKSKNLSILVGMGGSYFNTIYDPITNPNNQGITTELVWSFRAHFNYRLYSRGRVDWKAGIGYFHHSNGHTRLPNQGLNSFLLSVSADIKSKKAMQEPVSFLALERSIYPYLSFRGGYGINVLGKPEPFNDKKPVYTFAGEYGKVINNTYKLGVGFYYRYYEHYFDYINDNESLVQDGREFESLRDAPVWNASALGVYGSGEILLNHVGLEVQIGLNIHKPAYKIDWRLNQGWAFIPREIPVDNNFVLGEFDTKFRVKHLVSSRMGMKYYLWGTKEHRRNNVYVGFHINSNGGQADFTDVSLGYVYNFDLKGS
ncbi:acyloxyacyl hydrolase [Aureisphaera galaxeae]|uniref:acyloxyacyl hydrolase n=1 Tax=Aureisphaera galaxeae TaxID=1538023 RepID=UPI0023500E5F|nr:acyloxyacyl hydrolase [Aureisphaera galaxeae]MDC8004534.1 acyloxyacyl hydrolase [Aureisphaera galaxeae]